MHSRLPQTHNHGFSLVELSIVLVILGLLTGGILGGQSLIRAAELRSVSADFQRYTTAMYTFRDKYFMNPGDMTNATAFWGSAGGNGADATCYANQAAGSIATCNGNGNGQIMESAGINNMERFLAWKQLANAGLIEGNYTGKTTDASGNYTANNLVPGVNLPRSKLSNGFFDFAYLHQADAGNADFFAGSRLGSNLLFFANQSLAGGVIKPEEAWNIDTKLDDSSPVTGRIYTVKRTSASGGGNCATSDANTATYDFTQTANNCHLYHGLY